MAVPRTRRSIVRDVAEVVCDESGRVGPLSYLVPDGITVAVGDAVKVPFGTKERYGVVVGPGDATKATKAVLEVFGPRSDQAEINLAAACASEHFATFAQVAPRLGPRTRRGNPPLVTGALRLEPGPDSAALGYPLLDEACTRRLLAPAPGVPVARLAALEAVRLAADGQVLVLCPTKQSVERVLAEFADGAARLDQVPGAEQPSPWRGFVEGTVRVAVATRTAALWAAHDLAGIVVVDEDHPGHDEPSQPYTNARTLAIRRTAVTGSALTLISTNPSLPALAGNVRLVAVGSRNDWPSGRFIDTSVLEPAERVIPNAVLAAIADARRAGRPAIVVAPQSSSTPRCIRCRQAGDPAEACGRCGGTVRGSLLAKEHLAEACRKATVVSIPELLTSEPRPGALVVVLAADMLDAAPDLVPSRTIAQVCTAATRVAGVGGEVVVTTRGNLPKTVVDLVLRPDVRRHARRVWAAAKADGLPPFSVLVEVRHQRASAPRPPTLPAPIRVVGPRKVADGEFETLVFVPADRRDLLRPWIERLRRTGKVQVRVH